MRLYHTGDTKIVVPDIHRGRLNADFGQGFYTTPDIDFSNRWAKKGAVINEYELDITQLSIKRFTRTTEWFEYIFNNRRTDDTLDDDVVIGPIANDTIFDTLGILSSGFLSSEEALKLLMIGPEYIQVAIKSEAAANKLKWLTSYEDTDIDMLVNWQRNRKSIRSNWLRLWKRSNIRLKWLWLWKRSDMGLNVVNNVSVITVFIQGLLSFFSPCVLPLIPVYIGYLSGGTIVLGEDNEYRYDRKKVIINTIFFVIGISFSFFLLGLGFRFIGRLFGGHQILFARIGGILVCILGLYQLGVFGQLGFMNKEGRLPVRFDKLAMSPVTALFMGFVFSFAWTPCVGPVLSSVLLMASSVDNSTAGFLLIGVYTLGFVIPFLLTGFFTTTLLQLFKKHRSVVQYTAKAGGCLLIIMGLLMITGQANRLSGYLSVISGSSEYEAGDSEKQDSEVLDKNEGTDEIDVIEESEKKEESEALEGLEESEKKETDVIEGIEESGKKEETEAIEGLEETDKKEETDVTDKPENTKEDVNTEETDKAERETETEENTSEQTEEDTTEIYPAPDFALVDQYGETHSLSDYRGKYIFLNFWATWCPPCRGEMPDIQELYEETQSDPDSDLVILGVAFPGNGGEKDAEGIADFLEENGYTYPTVMDSEMILAEPYYITAYPTTYMIDKKGNIYGYITGAMDKATMEDVIRQTREESE